MVFSTAFSQGYWLVVFLALINTVISLYYYLLVVKAMYIDENDTPVGFIKTSLPMKVSLLLCLAGILLFGLMGNIYQFIFNWS
jgi:NADH-quinone oxidoreductase subunit N